ncbi:hypothetical protein GC089_12900 [Cellulomonas sp. JZ18]|nr:hypothetical protein GC089_12900 [Cellulomonas sp. JZ18]
MSDQHLAAPVPADESARVERASATTARPRRNPLRGAAGRNLGLVIALALVCAVGVATAGSGSRASTTS